MKIVFSNRNYIILFVAMTVTFIILYIFAWNLILLPDFYIRIELWTPLNILFLIVIPFLSGLSITLSIYSLKINIPIYKKGFGYLAIIPSFFASACPGCVPLILSFTAATIGIGISIARFGHITNILSTIILLIAIVSLSSAIYKCKNSC